MFAVTLVSTSELWFPWTLRPQWPKFISIFRPKRFKRLYPWGDTYPKDLHRGIPSARESCFLDNFPILLLTTNIQFLLINHFSAANDAEASIEEVLVFVTGASRPPPLGFDEPATITFLDDEPFAMANTCANTIRLPVCYSEYEEFKRKMDFAIKNSPCFGYAWTVHFAYIVFINQQ